MLNILYGYAAWYASTHLQREVSAHKLINWLKRKSRLARALHQGRIEALFEDLIPALPQMLCKQKRKRRTTHQLLEDQVSYMDHFLEDDMTPLDKTA
jgi:hypothetical protein